MSNDSQMFNEFIQYLINHGYPKSSLALEWSMEKYKADLAVLDIETNEVIALFFIKNKKSLGNLHHEKEQFKNMVIAMRKKNIPTYVVNLESRGNFYIEKVSMNEVEFQPNKIFTYNISDQFISYEILKNSRQNALVKEKMEEQEGVSLWIWYLSWTIALALIIFLIIDLIGNICLETKHLILLGGISGFLLFPFIKKLRIANFEIEMLKNKSESQKKTNVS